MYFPERGYSDGQFDKPNGYGAFSVETSVFEVGVSYWQSAVMGIAWIDADLRRRNGFGETIFLDERMAALSFPIARELVAESFDTLERYCHEINVSPHAVLTSTGLDERTANALIDFGRGTRQMLVKEFQL